MDRSAWPPGPWDNEPDSVSWVSAVGLPCEMRRNGRGAWCGYVGADPKHPTWSHVDWDLDAHRGVSWKGSSVEFAKMYEGEGPFPMGLQWAGFHCIESGDRWPRPWKDSPFVASDSYRDVAYVRGQCEILAAQMDAAELLTEAGFGGARHLRGAHWSAPEWAIEVARRFHVPREERATMLRRLASDPVAAQLAGALGVRA